MDRPKGVLDKRTLGKLPDGQGTFGFVPNYSRKILVTSYNKGSSLYDKYNLEQLTDAGMVRAAGVGVLCQDKAVTYHKQPGTPEAEIADAVSIFAPFFLC